MYIPKEDIKKISEIQGTSVAEKNRLFQLQELFRKADPLTIARELDELINSLFFYANMASDEFEMMPKEAQEHVYNVKCIKDFLLNIYEFERDYENKKPGLLRDLKDVGVDDKAA